MKPVHPICTCEDPITTCSVEIMGGETAIVDGCEEAPISLWQSFGGPMATAVSLALETFRVKPRSYLAGRVDLITGTVTIHWSEP